MDDVTEKIIQSFSHGGAIYGLSNYGRLFKMKPDTNAYTGTWVLYSGSELPPIN